VELKQTDLIAFHLTFETMQAPRPDKVAIEEHHISSPSLVRVGCAGWSIPKHAAAFSHLWVATWTATRKCSTLVRSIRHFIGESDQASLLNETLDEEKETDEKLTELAEQINTEANGEEGAEEGEKKGVFRADKKKSRRVA
jgi:hypothetical protein